MAGKLVIFCPLTTFCIETRPTVMELLILVFPEYDWLALSLLSIWQQDTLQSEYLEPSSDRGKGKDTPRCPLIRIADKPPS